MNAHYTYSLIDAGTILFPVLLSFDKKVAFYKQWKNLWPGMLLTGAFFIVWDILFNKWGVWSFNDAYIVGLRIGGLPIEEWLFFITVPYACAFIYECLLQYLHMRKRADNGWWVLLLLSILLMVVGVYFHDRAYTFSSFTFCGIALLLVYLLRKRIALFRADAFLLTFLISTLPFFIVNGLLTSMPVVLYNDTENLGIRIYTIPFEDNFYGMLLMLGNIAMMELRRARAASVHSRPIV
jgi:lycopene cyclase domain-containing protein